MRRFTLLAVLGLILMALSVAGDVVNNSGTEPADSIAIPFYVLDSAGGLASLATGDTVFLVVFYPNGTVAYRDSAAHNGSKIVVQAIDNSKDSVYSWKEAVASIDGDGKDGLYSYILIVSDKSSAAQRMALTGFFQLYQGADFDATMDAARIGGDTLRWATVADVWRNIDTTDVDTSLIGEWLASNIGGGSSNWSNDQRDSVLAAMTATAWLAKTWPDAVITAAKFATDAITATVVADGAIDAGAIATSAIGAAEIADGAIDAATFATDAITAAAVGDGCIDAGAIATSAIGAAEVADNAIDAGAIAADAIGASEIAASAIGASELATDAIGADELAASCITSSEIATGAIAADEIAADAIGASEIADLAIDAGAIATSAIDSTKIAASAIGASEIAADAIGASEIAAAAIGASELATDAITGEEIALAAIGANEIATNAITADKIAASAIGADEIAADAIGASEIAASAIGASELATDAIGADEIAADAIDASAIAAGAVTEVNTAVLAALDTLGILSGHGLNTWSKNVWGYLADSMFIGRGLDTIAIVIVKHPPDSGYYPDSTRVTGY